MATRTFGRRLRARWELAADGTFLNHGSYGACPKPVLAEQARIRAAMESQPDVFFRESVAPGDTPTLLREAAARLAAFVNVPAGALAFVENATTGVQSALQCVPLGAGDELLITDHTYNAVRLMVEARCAQTGARPNVVHIGSPDSAEAIVEAFEAAVTPQVRLAIVDHITSPTALVMPLDRIVPALRRHGAARVIVDGAHAVGQLPLDVTAVGADWYVSNAHKWLYAPRGCAFLHAAPSVALQTHPLVVSHHIERGFPESFDWLGTRDCSAWLAVPAAIDFFSDLDPAALRAHNRALLEEADRAMSAIGAHPVAPLALNAWMRSFHLPQERPATREDAVELVRALWRRDRIQSMAVAFSGRLLVRVSAQAYVEADDVRALADALAHNGWPGR